MIDVNTFTSEVKTNSWMALCYRQQPSLPLNHRRRYYLLHFPVAAAVQGHHGMSDVFWEFMWKEIIGLVVAVGTGVLWGLLAAGVFGTTV